MAKASLMPTIAAPGNGNWWEQIKSAPEVPARTKVIQTITFRLGSFDDENRTFRAIASTPFVDRSGDVIKQDGWDLTQFINNPVIPWCHDYYQPPVARAIEIGVADGALQFTYQAPPKGMYEFADTVWDLYRNQFMFAFSVGFIPKKADGGKMDWEDYDWDGTTYEAAELLEISAVVVPANPQALALSQKSGIISEKAAKSLMAKTANAMKNLQEALNEAKTTAETEAEKFEGLEAAVEKAVRRALEQVQTEPKSVTDDKNGGNDQVTKNDKTEEAPELKSVSLTEVSTTENNKDMKQDSTVEVKDLGEGSDGGGDVTPVEHGSDKKGYKMCAALHEVADTLKAHSEALNGHAKTMKAHADLLQTKVDGLHKAADYLKDLLDHDGDETTRPDNDGDEREESVSAGNDGLDKKTVAEVVAKSAEAETEEAPAQTEAADEVTPEPKAEEVPAETAEKVVEAPAEKTEAAEKTEETETKGAESGDVKSEEEAPTDGADHEEEATPEAELVDPEDLSEEQIEKLLEMVNAELKAQKSE